MSAPAEPITGAEILPWPPRATAEYGIRTAKMMIARCQGYLEEGDIRSNDPEIASKAIVAPQMIKRWQDELRRAEARLAMLDADDTLHFNGRAYQAQCGPEGAN